MENLLELLDGGDRKVLLSLKGITADRKASRSQERPHKMKWFPSEKRNSRSQVHLKCFSICSEFENTVQKEGKETSFAA